jgi:hypothetical protein
MVGAYQTRLDHLLAHQPPALALAHQAFLSMQIDRLASRSLPDRDAPALPAIFDSRNATSLTSSARNSAFRSGLGS